MKNDLKEWEMEENSSVIAFRIVAFSVSIIWSLIGEFRSGSNVPV